MRAAAATRAFVALALLAGACSSVPPAAVPDSGPADLGDRPDLSADLPDRPDAPAIDAKTAKANIEPKAAGFMVGGP